MIWHGMLGRSQEAHRHDNGHGVPLSTVGPRSGLDQFIFFNNSSRHPFPFWSARCGGFHFWYRQGFHRCVSTSGNWIYPMSRKSLLRALVSKPSHMALVTSAHECFLLTCEHSFLSMSAREVLVLTHEDFFLSTTRSQRLNE
jgi:hypothetical protein